MKKIGWILVLLGLLGVAFLLYKDVDSVKQLGGDASKFKVLDDAKKATEDLAEKKGDLMKKIDKFSK